MTHGVRAEYSILKKRGSKMYFGHVLEISGLRLCTSARLVIFIPATEKYKEQMKHLAD